jgi:hypothetical protein
MRKTAFIGAVLGIASTLLVAGDASSLAAQTTFTACRVPNVGAIYMIGVAGAPSDCLDASHVEFSWTEGGTVADGSITTAKLADDAVTSAKIAANSLTADDLASNSVGGSETGIEIVFVESTQATQFDLLVATCPTGKRVVSGGHWLTVNQGGITSQFTTITSYPSSPTEWTVVGYFQTAPTSWTWRVYAICMIA